MTSVGLKLISTLLILFNYEYMIQSSSFYINLNEFFNKIFLRKQYIKKLTQKTLLLKSIREQNYKKLRCSLFVKNKRQVKHKNLVTYIIEISFSRSNTLLHVTDFSGALKFCCSAGNLSFSGKNKTTRVSVFKAMARILSKNLNILQNKPVALHLKNVGFRKF